ncbi:ribonuclease 3-like protein 1 [Sesamum indicum]|uniref:Ribonuclease 3-like protein 1 n=1 Tax=Sesamum indicum TaxID=4182 RepID=A0A6I9SST2_SESIN|nr:ribonuclease 3-like protein 1 [Sesamum indicum]
MEQSRMVGGPVEQESTTENTHEKRADEGKISGEYNPTSAGSGTKDAARKGSPKADLHELCAQEHWKQPVFECCNEEGPDHNKLFTFKVVVETEEASMAVLECFGNPRPSKKAAAEDAAEGALWCLKHMGYQLKKQ